MTVRPHRNPATALPWLATMLLCALPGAAAARPLLEEELSLDPRRPLLLAAASQKATDPSLDFDLLGKPAAPKVKIDDAALKRRRTMLDLHQATGLGLLALQLATTVVGQLNYSDKYGSNPPVTGRYELSHTVLAYTTLAVFAVDGGIALLAPGLPAPKDRYDRLTLHKVGMAFATAGMVAQGVVGVYTDQREGRLNQARAARAHLVIGYTTLAAVGVAVGALVF
jgi:hypothetical protein